MVETNNTFKRLYVFTGKGGVGKTTLSLSFAKFLQKEGRKVLFVSFEESPYAGIFQELSLNFHLLDLYQSAFSYIAKKLGTTVIASWIIKSHFFKAMLNIIPGFSYLIFLGQILENLKKDPELIIVFDSPSSGHVLTMFESLQVFKDIFQAGILFEDILEMLKLLEQNDFLKVNICTIPTTMALQEATELQEELKILKIRESEIIVNNSLFFVPQLKTKVDLPSFLSKKLELEREVLSLYKEKIEASLPHVTSLEYPQVIYELIPFVRPMQ